MRLCAIVIESREAASVKKSDSLWCLKATMNRRYRYVANDAGWSGAAFSTSGVQAALAS